MFCAATRLWSAAAVAFVGAASADPAHVPAPEPTADATRWSGDVDPFLSEVVEQAVNAGVTHFYLTHQYGDSEDLGIAADLVDTLQRLGHDYVFCREMSPDSAQHDGANVENLGEPRMRPAAARWLAGNVAQTFDTERMNPVALAKFEAAMASDKATPCALSLYLPSMDMQRLVEERVTKGAGANGKTIFVGSFGADHGLTKRVTAGWRERPWATRSGQQPDEFKATHEATPNDSFNAFRRRHELVPNSVAFIASSQLLANELFAERHVHRYYGEEGFAIIKGPHNHHADLSVVLPETAVPAMAPLAARRPGLIQLTCKGFDGCPPVDYPKEVRQLVQSLVKDGQVAKILVARQPQGRVLPLVTEALRGAIDTRSTHAPPGVSFYCKQTQDFEREFPGWAMNPAIRGSLSQRLAWEMLDRGPAVEGEMQRFAWAMAFSKVNPNPLRFCEGSLDELEAFLRDDAPAVASVDLALALEGFSLAQSRGVQALLLIEGEEVPVSLAGRRDCAFTHLPLLDSTVMAVVSASQQALLERFEAARGGRATVQRLGESAAASDGVHPFFSEVLEGAVKAGVTHFYFTESHGDSENLAIAAELVEVLRRLGMRFIFCRETSPLLPQFNGVNAGNVADPGLRAAAARWLAIPIANALTDSVALHKFEAAMASDNATPCALQLYLPHMDMQRLIEERIVEPIHGGTKVIHVGNFGARHGLSKRIAPGMFERPWHTLIHRFQNPFEAGDEAALQDAFDAFQRRDERNPNTVAFIASSQLLALEEFMEHDIRRYYSEDGLAVVKGPFNSRADLTIVLPQSTVPALQQIGARHPGLVELNCTGHEGCPPAAFPMEIRRLVYSLVGEGEVGKILVARQPGGLVLPLVAEALQGTADTRSTRDPPGISFYCKCKEPFESAWASDPLFRAGLATRLAWEMLDGASASEIEMRRLGQAMTFSKVNPKALPFSGIALENMETFLRDDSPAIASIDLALALEGFSLAHSRGIPVLLLIEGEDVPESLRGRTDCAFARLPLMDSKAMAIVDASLQPLLERFEVGPRGASRATAHDEL